MGLYRPVTGLTVPFVLPAAVAVIAPELDTVILPVPYVNALMPVPELAAIVAVLSTVTLPKIPDSGGFGILDGELFPPRYPTLIAAGLPPLTSPDVIVPAASTVSELGGTNLPTFTTLMPEPPESMFTPPPVVTLALPELVDAKIPVEDEVKNDSKSPLPTALAAFVVSVTVVPVVDSTVPMVLPIVAS